jgi:RND family efflux transporter MFP subunit
MALDRSILGREVDQRPHQARRPSDKELEQERLLWLQFAEAANPKAFCQNWLALQCRMLGSVRSAMVLLGEPDRGPFMPVAFWPDARVSMQHLTGAAERALKERRGLVDDDSPVGNAVPETCNIAYPVEVSGKIHGVVVLEVERAPGQEVQKLMRQLYWNAGWLEILIRRSEALRSTDTVDQLRKVLDIVTTAVEHPSFSEAAMAFVTKLATSLEFDRVSLGLLKRKQVRVRVVSHSTDPSKQTNLLRAIGAAMDEAIDQKNVLLYPQPPDALPMVVRAHEALSREGGSATILTIPMESHGKTIGGLVLERSDEQPPDKTLTETCETAAALAGAVLENKRLEERLLLRKAVDSVAVQLGRLLGPGYLLRKLIWIGIVALTIFFTFFKIDYRVTATTYIEGVVQRVVAAPFNGYVKEAPVRPGDVVKAGEVLCFLDDRDLKLERVKWLTEREQLAKQFSEAMAKHERSQILILRAKMNQAEAQLSLIDEQLSRTKVVAPFHGVVMSGDLSQSLGAPVERGQVLFEVAPLDEYRVIVQIDERDITEILVGQRSELVLPSMPGETFPFRVEKITPVSVAKEGRNTFRVEGRMEQNPPNLRPGMEGVGKITVDRRLLIWVWTHEAIDWLRLQLWRWMP